MSKDKDLLLVFGYVRIVEILLSNPMHSNTFNVIPNSITNLCHLFYHIVEGWDFKFKYTGTNINWKTTNDLIIENNSTRLENEAQSIFLQNIFDSGQHHWKFKIISEPSHNLEFGIWKNGSTKPPRGWFTSNAFGYSYIVKDGTLNDREYPNLRGDGYGKKCTKGDTIEMFVSMNNLELSYSVNGKYLGKAWDIDKAKYRGAVCLQNDTVKFISYDNSLDAIQKI